MSADILDRIDEMLTFYSAGLGEELTVPVEGDPAPLPASRREVGVTVRIDAEAAINQIRDALRILMPHRDIEWMPLAGQRFTDAQRIPYHQLNEAERLRLHAWVKLHDLDPGDVPLDGILGPDPTTCEWRIRVYRRRCGRIYLNPDGETAASCVVRRRAKAPLPWPVWSEAESS